MNPINLIAQDLFDKVRSRFTNLELGDSKGSVTTDPMEARFFDFDFIFENNKLGRISISINDQASLKIFYARNLLETADDQLVDIWYNFLREMRFFAKSRMLKFDTRDITKSNLDKTDFQYLATKGKKEETVQESVMFGSTKSSYLPLENTKLIIRHSKKVDETQRGSRSRNIHAIYVENAEGERFRCPYNSLALGKAMQRHVANGGKPYDDVGVSIIQIAEQINQLLKVKRHVGNTENLSEDLHEIMSKCSIKLESLRKELKSLSKQHNYDRWKTQAKKDNNLLIDRATLEDYKNKFTVSSFNEELKQYFPLIHSIMQETNEIDLEEYLGNDDVSVKEDEQQPATDNLPQYKSWGDAAKAWSGFRSSNPLANTVINKIPGLGQAAAAMDVGAAAIQGDYKGAAKKAIGFIPGAKDINTAMQVGDVAKSVAAGDMKSAATGALNIAAGQGNQAAKTINQVISLPNKIEKAKDFIDRINENKPNKVRIILPEDQFENWVNSIDKNKFSEDNITDLKKLLDSDLTVGVDGMNAIESLEDIGIDDADLFNQLKTVAVQNKEKADTMPADPIIKAWLQQYDYDAFEKLEADATTSQEPAKLNPPTQDSSMNQVEPANTPTAETEPDSIQKLKQTLGAPVSESKKNIDAKIEEMILSFYNRNQRNFPLGETGVISKVTKEFGEKFESIIKKKVYSLSKNRL